PEKESTHFIADLTEVCGETEDRHIPQGKSHVEFYAYKDKLYFATHVGVYEMIDGMERMPQNPPNGFRKYRGGHILAYDTATGKVEDCALIPEEGVLTMEMDTARGNIFLITWPTGEFIHYSVKSGGMRRLGKISQNGEAGIPGNDYRVLCRSMFVDPADGAV